MFDIDKYLEDMSIREYVPDKMLVSRTRSSCAEVSEKTQRRKAAVKSIKKAVLIGVPAAAVLLLGIFLGATFFGAQDTTAETAVAYYTVDINPSVCINVGEDDIVTGYECLNDDAVELMAGIDCIGKPAAEAIKMVISAAEEAGYLGEDEQYVLVGFFGMDDDQAAAALEDLQAQLENSFGDMINLLLVSGSFEDKELADNLNVSAGLLKLSQMAEGVEITNEDKIEDIVDEVNEVNKENFTAPKLSASIYGTGIKLSWSKLDFEAMGYTGEVIYHVLAGDTYDEALTLSAQEITSITFNSGDTQTLYYKVYPSEDGIAEGEAKYYSICVEYSDGTAVFSNAVQKTMPEDEEDEPQATQTPEPDEDEEEGYTVSGRVSGDYVILNWDKETSSELSGYKIVASKTNPNPAYPGRRVSQIYHQRKYDQHIAV